MSGLIEKLIVALIAISGIICAYAVLTPNSLFIG